MAKLLLRVYFAAFAALPLSYIHIDDIRGAHALVSASAHQEHNVHLLLHRIFSAHFDNRSDHCSTSALDGLSGTASKKALQKFLCPAPLAALASVEAGTALVPDGAACAMSPFCDDPQAASAIRSLSSGPSPPAV